MSNLLSVPFKPQSAEGYCLPACAEMVLTFYGIRVTQEQLARLFETQPPMGTPFPRIMRLEKRGVAVEIGKYGDWDQLFRTLTAGKPCIVAVDLLFMPYAQLDSRHVVVVIGCDADTAFVLDPAESAEPIQVTKDGFIAAWTEMECSFAVIHRN